MAATKQERLDKLQDALVGLLIQYEAKLLEGIKNLNVKKPSVAGLAAGLRVVTQANQALRASMAPTAANDAEAEEGEVFAGLRITG